MALSVNHPICLRASANHNSTSKYQFVVSLVILPFCLNRMCLKISLLSNFCPNFRLTKNYWNNTKIRIFNHVARFSKSSGENFSNLISSNYSDCHGSQDRLRLCVITCQFIILIGPDAGLRKFWLSDLVFENLKIFPKKKLYSKNIFGLLKIKIPKFKNLKVGWTFEKKVFQQKF